MEENYKKVNFLLRKTKANNLKTMNEKLEKM